jgi:hypothetical protein
VRHAAFSQYVLHDVHVTQVQLNELYALLSAVKDGELSKAEAITRLSRSPHWVWMTIDPVTKLLLTIDVGPRTLAMAQCVVHQVVQVLAPDCVPVFLTDGFKAYITALLTHFVHWIQPARRQAKGPLPKPRWMRLTQPRRDTGIQRRQGGQALSEGGAITDGHSGRQRTGRASAAWA